MISEGSCDADNWSNDAENYSYIILIYKIDIFIIVIFHNIYSLSVFLIK